MSEPIPGPEIRTTPAEGQPVSPELSQPAVPELPMSLEDPNTVTSSSVEVSQPEVGIVANDPLATVSPEVTPAESAPVSPVADKLPLDKDTKTDETSLYHLAGSETNARVD